MAKSELILAFNEIAEMRKLPRDVIIEALKAALVSAYRRNAGISSAQYVEARVDDLTGDPTIWVEKEVVEDVQSPQTEVILADARKVDPDVELGDMALVEDTPEDFGRIAAQTAKQVILQRMREAEREAQYQEYQDRVGDLVTGTVQSATSDVVTIGLGRTEAILPRSQQVPGERYKTHDKVRAYVMEVRRTNRGPQIVVSRTHRNMLRRLLEYEVPEIYNGTVEIKSIAREPGARSKVAVAALQPGADPVGACVGMRGVRIQSIVRELNNEKIDVIEWNEDDAVFISKALSPARVSAVFLDEDLAGSRTATVMVPDDQLSLAIGREGQNARLGAKLTGWRIDIKSVSEAAQEIFENLPGDDEIAEIIEANQEMVEKVGLIIEKKTAGRPIMPEDYQLLVDFVKLTEGFRHRQRDVERAEMRQQLQAAREQVPGAAYLHPLEDTDLPLRVYNLLADAGLTTVGEMMELYYYNPDELLAIDGFGPSALEEVESVINSIEFEEPEPVEEVAAAVGDEVELEAIEELDEAGEPVAEGELAAEPVAESAADGWVDEEAEARARRAQLIAELDSALGAEAVETPSAELPAAEAVEGEAPVLAEAAEGAPQVRPDWLDVDFAEESPYDYEGMTDEEKEELARKRAKARRRQLVYDEDAGRVIAKRRRKQSRHDWEDEVDDYLDK
ncbi:MAG: transcription termination/antitermination protein NusA [Anaerolineae bacterium]|nr:transcription termination/antitermination protein NusA [Anaerolineae bacterium]